jgi:PAS domain S-box-containing protein
MPNSNPLLWRKPSMRWSIGIAVVSVAAALLISRLPSFHLQSAPVSLFLCAVMISAWFGGLWPGLFAIVLSCLAFSYYFLKPLYSFAVNVNEIPRGVLFLLSALFVGSLTAAQRSATESLISTRDELKEAVQDLETANKALQAESDERKHAENKLRESERYLAEAQRLSHTGSWAWVPATGEIRYWSEECFRVLGFDSQAGHPRDEAFFQRTHPKDHARFSEAVERARIEKAEFELNYRIIRPNGQTRDLHVVGHPVLGPSGDLIEFVGTVIDITEHKQAQEEKEKLRQVLEDIAHVNRVTMMGELTASLAHEVNQPIAAAVTDAKTCIRWLTRAEPDLQEAREAASRTMKDAIRAGEIIHRIRLLFKKGTPQWELVDINDVVSEMTALLRDEATRHSVSLHTELASNLPKVKGDRVQLQQVMMNLMVNSIDAMKEVDTTRELSIMSRRTEDEHLVVSVSDTGVGLPPQQTDKIFDPFFTTKLDGTGMGLRISRSIFESHGGRLWADNHSPRGASFYFTLPTLIEVYA